MEKVDISKNYSLREAINYVPLKTKDTLSRYVNRYQGADWSVGKIQIKKRAKGKGKTSTRYVISGEWIREFNKLYTAGKLTGYAIFTPDEVRYTLKDMLKYCEDNGIVTVQEFIKKKNEEETIE